MTANINKQTVEHTAAIRARVTQFSGYKTSDGTVHATEADAFTHEKGLDRREQLSNFCSRHGCRDMDSSDVAQMLDEHHAELLQILQ
jgi:hypothetical protein